MFFPLHAYVKNLLSQKQLFKNSFENAVTTKKPTLITGYNDWQWETNNIHEQHPNEISSEMIGENQSTQGTAVPNTETLSPFILLCIFQHLWSRMTTFV